MYRLGNIPFGHSKFPRKSCPPSPKFNVGFQRFAGCGLLCKIQKYGTCSPIMGWIMQHVWNYQPHWITTSLHWCQIHCLVPVCSKPFGGFFWKARYFRAPKFERFKTIQSFIQTNWEGNKYVSIQKSQRIPSDDQAFSDQQFLYPIGSMYGIFTYIYHKNQPNVGTWILWV